MVMLAWRNLIHDRTRLLISIGGVALSIVLVLVLNGIFWAASKPQLATSATSRRISG